MTYIAGTGDPRLNALKATYNNASSFVISASMLQVNLGSGGTVYDQNSSPRVNAGESIWLGTFEIAAPVNWVTGNNANPSWQMRGTSISVYDAPPSSNIATVCSGNPDDADLEFPSAFSAGRSAALIARNAVTTIASRIKAFTSYTCGDNNLRAGIETDGGGKN